jgi:hypothetical protein
MFLIKNTIEVFLKKRKRKRNIHDIRQLCKLRLFWPKINLNILPWNENTAANIQFWSTRALTPLTLVCSFYTSLNLNIIYADPSNLQFTFGSFYNFLFVDFVKHWTPGQGPQIKWVLHLHMVKILEQILEHFYWWFLSKGFVFNFCQV